ncbi:gamma-glutamyltransferase [Sneathiella limimaris]|uniref:gamma-glutamyltransferase n=1 Tax=Sneathiella limimaris TaxID=1964213 RepID=UPI00146B2690|nr:gamma-glutamyltransferase [Sneathiella limimaris]
MTDKNVVNRLFNSSFPLLNFKVKKCHSSRQWKALTSLLAAGSLLFLAACEDSSTTQLGVIGSVEGPLGGAAADEPRAVLIAEDILSAGGTAADAATALYFTLSVTYPVAGSLGGGGECLAYSKQNNRIDNLKFPVGVGEKGGAIGIPGNIRGFAALHARYGKLSWSSLLAPAEKLANFGENMSRAQYMAMADAGRDLYLDRQLRELYLSEDGTLKKEGSRIQQIRLSSVLSNIRSNGGAFFYSGNLAKAFIEEANRIGGELTTTDLVYYRPVWQQANTFDVDVLTVGTSNSEYGKLFQSVWQKMFQGKGFLHIGTDISYEKLAESSATTFKDYARYNPFGAGGQTSFVTADNEGNAVACVVGLGKPFGSGNVGSISGIVLAEPLTDKDAAFPTTPVLIMNRPNKLLFYAGGVTGGAAGTLSSVYTALKVVAENKSLDEAIRVPRLFTMGPGLPLLYERGIEPDVLQDLTKAHPVMLEVNKIGSVNAIHCAEGKPEFCQSSADPRGFGLSINQR